MKLTKNDEQYYKRTQLKKWDRVGGPEMARLSNERKREFEAITKVELREYGGKDVS